jgi:hypothetical protein
LFKHSSTGSCEFRRATLEDFSAILALTSGENLYDGTDYLPFALKAWLEEGAHGEFFCINKKKRLNGEGINRKRLTLFAVVLIISNSAVTAASLLLDRIREKYRCVQNTP